MIRRKVRSIKMKRYTQPGRRALVKCLICLRKDIYKSLTMLVFTLPKAALNLTKRDMKKQNQRS